MSVRQGRRKTAWEAASSATRSGIANPTAAMTRPSTCTRAKTSIIWEGHLGRSLAPGSFGENLTTEGIDINRALIGERWRVGDRLELQITDPRIPCSTFRGWIGEPGWLKTFTVAVRPGSYLRVLNPGHVSAGDQIVVLHRPTHGVTVALVFRALTREPELLPRILDAADDLPEETRSAAVRGETFSIS
jgi:MOSC domain-containing protein YiiM